VALLEKEAVRFAESLDDYDYVRVTDIGGWGQTGSGSWFATSASTSPTRSRRMRLLGLHRRTGESQAVRRSRRCGPRRRDGDHAICGDDHELRRGCRLT
jgi:hypothetical protein